MTLLDWIIIILALLFAAILGFAACAGWYWGYDRWKRKKLIKNIPIDKKEIADGGIKILSEKEVIENERNASAKFREFEKLKRISENSGADGNRAPERADKFYESGIRDTVPEGRRDLPPPPSDSAYGSQRRIKFE